MNMQEEASACHRTPVVSAFLIKTYQLVEDASTDHIVSWGKDQTTFVVWSPSEMARLVLPLFFKHIDFIGFVRQLSFYGFERVASDRWEFANEFFRKGAKHLLCKIQGWKTEKAPLSGPPPKNSADDLHFSCNDSTAYMPPSPSHMMSPVEEVLRSATLDISSVNKQLAIGGHAKLLSELTRIRCLYEESLSIMRQKQSPVKERNSPRVCLSGSRDSQCQQLQHQHSGELPFKVLDDSLRKEGLRMGTNSSLLENTDRNRVSMSSAQDLQMGYARENGNEESRDKTGAFIHAPSDLTSINPALQSPTMVSACVQAGREPLGLLNENNKLRRENAILLSELMHFKTLYNYALSIIEIQKIKLEEANDIQRPSGVKIVNGQCGDTDGHFVHSSAAAPLNGLDIVQHKRDFTASQTFRLDACHDAKKL